MRIADLTLITPFSVDVSSETKAKVNSRVQHATPPHALILK